MPSIRDLFGIDEEDPEAGSAEFDVDAFFSAAEDAMAAHNADHQTQREAAGVPLLTRAGEMAPETPVVPVMEATAEVVEAIVADVPRETSATMAPEVIDPLLALPPERRAALLALDQVMSQSPAQAARVLQGLTAPEAAPVAEPVVAQLPDEIDPNSFEAQLWQQNQDMKRELASLSGAVRQQSKSYEETRAQSEAAEAVRSFAMRYQGQLTEEQIGQISAHAGQSGMASTFAQSPTFSGNLRGAYERALEDTLWTNESFRQFVIPTVAEPALPGPTVEGEQRKRTLGALSSAASPVAAAPVAATPLETREDGRLTPQSRQRAIQDAATAIARSRNSNY